MLSMGFSLRAGDDATILIYLTICIFYICMELKLGSVCVCVLSRCYKQIKDEFVLKCGCYCY